MFKKVFLLLILTLLPLKVLAFSDVSEGNTYYLPLKYLEEHQVVSGYENNTFKPFNNINRVEALSLLNKAIPYQAYSIVEKPIANLKSTLPTATASTNFTDFNDCKFSDIDQADWFYELVCMAKFRKISVGYPDGKFYPAKNINKVEALKLAILHSGITVPAETANNFNDVSASDWFSQYTQLAKEKTYYIENRDGNLLPAESLNRGDFALLIYRIIKSRTENSFFGRASYYHTALEGASTSSGEAYQAEALTAAHKTLPFGTKVKVTNIANGKTVTVKINDRGPYTNGFVLDLSATAFSELANLSTGLINVEYQIIP